MFKSQLCTYAHRLKTALPLCKTTVSLATAHFVYMLLLCVLASLFKVVRLLLIMAGDRKTKSAESLFLVVSGRLGSDMGRALDMLQKRAWLVGGVFSSPFAEELLQGYWATQWWAIISSLDPSKLILGCCRSHFIAAMLECSKGNF